LQGSRTAMYTHLEVASEDQFRALELMSLTGASLLTTRASTAIAVKPWCNLNTAVQWSSRILRR
jgi:hypothetical protein